MRLLVGGANCQWEAPELHWTCADQPTHLDQRLGSDRQTHFVDLGEVIGQQLLYPTFLLGLLLQRFQVLE